MRKLIVLLLPLLFSAGTIAAQSPVDQIVAEAAKPSPLESNLEKLTDQIGGRVSGSPALAKAAAWGVAAFKAAGADSVHTETFTIPTSWAEGATQVNIAGPEGVQGARSFGGVGAGPAIASRRSGGGCGQR